MKKKLLVILSITALAMTAITGCGDKTSAKEVESTESLSFAEEDTSTEIDEETTMETEKVLEEASTETTEDGETVVTTESGEKIVLNEKTESTKNNDGSITYTTESGEKVTVQPDGKAVVATEVQKPSKVSDGSSDSEQSIEVKNPTIETTEPTKPSEEVKPEPSKPVEETTPDPTSEVVEPTGTPSSSEPSESKHTHSYSWVENGNTRVMKCSCGETTGPEEVKVAGVWGYYDDSSANTLFYKVNETRNRTGSTVNDDDGNVIDVISIPSLIYNSDLANIAKQRAAEVASNFSHDGLKTSSECLAEGYKTAINAKSAWIASSDHFTQMINVYYTTGATAVFYYDNDNAGHYTPYYVLVMN